MKKIFTILLLLLCSLCSVSYASEQEVVASFQEFTNQILTKIRESYAREDCIVAFKKESQYDRQYGLNFNYWYKVGKGNLRSSIDIQRTDSLITPYKGYLILSNELITYYSNDNYSGEYKTEEEARRATLKRYSLGESEYKFVYAYQDGQWILKALFWKHPDVTKGFWKDVELRKPLDMFIVRKTK